ncbi:MAG: ABC transporter permease [Rikenellaceae bacterium]|nr:ABC transporter permease [Rikenellaceae bacterium]
MKLSALRTYFKFLSRHKIYTVVSVVGFAISLTFVIILAIYARTEVSVDTFHEKKDRIFVIHDGENSGQFNTIPDYVASLCPEVETYTRLVTLRQSIGLTRSEFLEGRVLHADPDFFKMFTFPLVDGNPDNVLASAGSVVLTESTAAKLFGGEYPIGRTVLVDRDPLTVSGIMKDFPYNTHLESHDAVVHYSRITKKWGEDILNAWTNSGFPAYFLVRENSDFPSKSGMLLEKFKEDSWPYRDGYSDRVEMMPLDQIYFSQVGTAVLDTKKGSLNTTRIYMGIALLILAIAVLNYVNMTVAQAGFRGKEAAVRKLMGSGRGRIITQLLFESFVMTVLALLLAILLALLVEPYFNSILGVTLGLKERFSSNFIFVIAAGAVLLSLVSGLVPALAVASFDPIEIVKGTLTCKVKTGYSKVLIVFQFTVCTALLICTFLMREQASFLANYDTGFNKENIMMMSNSIGGAPEHRRAVRDRLMRIPGVEAVGFSSGSPLDGGNNNSYSIEDRPISMQVLTGDSVYFEIFQFRTTPTDAAAFADTKKAVFLNEAGYNAVQPDPTTLEFKGFDYYTVAGILEDIHIRPLHEAEVPTMFQYLKDDEWGPWHYVVKLSSGNVYETAEEVRKAYRELVGGAAFDWYFADERIYGWYENERRISRVMGTFTLLSIVIMVMGVFAMSLYMIRQKEKEIGVRKVSGATVGEVLGMLNLQSLERVGIAFVIACPLAWYGMNRWMQDFAYRINIGAWAFIAAGFVVTLLCLVSVSWQTFRAARANPVESLKSE